MKDKIFYQKGFKYILAKEAKIKTDIIGYSFDKEFFSLTLVGVLTAKIGYAWDGADCFPDLDSIIRGSLWHDLGYQMIEEKLLPLIEKPIIDKLLYTCCIEDGMVELIAKGVLKAVTKFGIIDMNLDNKILIAPIDLN